MLRLAVASSALLIVAGCASEPPAAPVATATATTQVAANEGDPKVVCEKDQATGSAIRATHCRVQQTAAERAANLDTFTHGPHAGPADPTGH